MIRKPILLGLLLVGGLLAIPEDDAWGRAGGGHSYSGGGGSRSSSGGSRSSSSSRSSRSSSSRRSSGSRSSGSGGEPLGWGGTLVLLGIAGVVVYFTGREHMRNSKVQSGMADLASRRRRKQEPEQIDGALRSIAARDPAFQRDSFLLMAEKAFVEIQHAWSSCDFDGARRLMSDGVLRRFTVQIELNDRHGKRNVTSGTRVLDKGIVGVECDDEFDTIHVQFRAALRDTDVPKGTPDAAAYAAAARAPETEFTEIWAFVRRPHPTGTAGKLAEGKCPSCGAPATRAPTSSCGYCGAILNSGSYDWVLSEITQVVEYEFRPGSLPSGYARLKAGDPAVNRQVLEDRASLVFWKWIESQATGEPRRFARHCTERAFASFAPAKGQATDVYAQAAVGGIDLSEVDQSGGWDRAFFNVRWSTSGAGTGIVRRNVLVLARRSGLLSNSKTGLSTDRCHNCAAVQKRLDAVECDHCGALLTQDWAFDDLLSPEGHRVLQRARGVSNEGLSALLDEFGDYRQRERALAVMVAAARADGKVTERESKLLETCAHRWSIDAAQLQGMLNVAPEQLQGIVPGSLDEGRGLVRALVAASLVDGTIDSAERKLLVAMAGHLKVPAEEIGRYERELRT